MGVRAINLNDMKEDELRFRILAEIVGEDRAPKRADFSAIARKLGIDRQSVAYHVKVLVKQAERGRPGKRSPHEGGDRC